MVTFYIIAMYFLYHSLPEVGIKNFCFMCSDELNVNKKTETTPSFLSVYSLEFHKLFFYCRLSPLIKHLWLGLNMFPRGGLLNVIMNKRMLNACTHTHTHTHKYVNLAIHALQPLITVGFRWNPLLSPWLLWTPFPLFYGF